jgi:hypothetical protein
MIEMARLYADENFDHGVVVELQILGHDVVTAQHAGMANQGIGDPEQLDFAIQAGRAVITFNRRHFRRLHAHVRPHCGIITCTEDDDQAALAKRVHAAISTLASLDNKLIKIYRPNNP